ncbi:acyl-CoA dehydrogenase family protein [Parvibaculum sp.]|jgi:alkylation response protein AidB-like acyl-CoA dehydrogenase|uniref:acyl-CoA dehydrogenase family protein n=1 Tax=Parvibaculum sp. TaxID=2024848 RepID=UPI000C54D664|nr:acyl-CoA dehydrogenase family protein [Parvibaculum sp.]MAM94335.1 acyl-CoA dehydrogenase [Parvibaculum sp.]|tara:strand:- start:49611 stop:50807 length:1197 start_codon:yes stop_codon:yes gene_type:complete
MEALEQFRQETRTWLEENCPPSMRTPMPEEETVWGGRNATYPNPDSKLWLDRMASRGWTAPTWPKEYGGGGLSKEESRVLQQELRRIKARPALSSFGIWMLGPALLEFANEEQKKEHLPKIVRGEIRWCQGYSEPGAGSDLAGLQTKCEDKGDHYLVNGQKIWTSYADKADWIFCLVRTDPTKKHEGISFLLFDMMSPGVEARPITMISGASPFCETFFTDVKVPKKNLVGELNKGWTIAKRLLQHEREMISGMGLGGVGAGGGIGSLEQVAKDYFGETDGKIASPSLRDHITRQKMDSKAFALTMMRSAEEAKAGQGPGAASSIFKYYGTELNKRRYELLLELMGTQALGWEGDGFNDGEINVTRSWLRSKGNSIEGGTSEIQLNVVSKRVLGLPDD